MAKETIESLCEKAQKAVAEGKNDHARKLFLQALSYRSDLPHVHYGLATVCYLMNDLTGAAYHFKEVTRLDPNRAGAFINLGAVYNKLNEHEEAIKILRRGIQLDLSRGEGYYNLGLVYRKVGKIDQAIQAYREATRVNPRMTDAHYNLANLYLEKGQFNLALVHYQHALELRPNWEKARLGYEQAVESIRDLEEPVEEPVDADTEDELEDEEATTLRILDPNRVIDPEIHGTILTHLNQATKESEQFSREFTKIIHGEIDTAFKALSTCLLQSDKNTSELDLSVKQLDEALTHFRSTKKKLIQSIERLRSYGEKLLQS